MLRHNWAFSPGTVWHAEYPKLTAWAEESIEETFAYHSLPGKHRIDLRPVNTLERVNKEISRRACVTRVFPNADSCLWMAGALAAVTHGG